MTEAPPSLNAQMTLDGIKVRLRGPLAVTHLSWRSALNHLLVASLGGLILGTFSGLEAGAPLLGLGFAAVVGAGHLAAALLTSDRLECTNSLLRVGSLLRDELNIPLERINDVKVAVVPEEYAQDGEGNDYVCVPERRFLVIFHRGALSGEQLPTTHSTHSAEWLARLIADKAAAARNAGRDFGSTRDVPDEIRRVTRVRERE